MLSEITLKNFTIIDEISVSFTDGLNIITGETGAGKSIIVDALNTVLGGRADSDLIKSGSDDMSVQALFVFDESDPLNQIVASLGVDMSSGELLIKRTVSRGVRGKIFINGSPGTLALLERIADDIVDIFSQHEHQALIRKENHLGVIDEACKLSKTHSEYTELYRKYVSIKREYDSLQENRKQQSEMLDFLRFQHTEISRAGLVAGEEEKLVEERNLLLNSEKLLTAAENAYEIIYESESSVLGALKKISAGLLSASGLDPKLAASAEALEKSVLQIEETALSLRDYGAGFDYQEGRLDEIEHRLETIKNLKRKYGDTIEKILLKKDSIETELDRIENIEESVSELESELKSVEKSAAEKARELSALRKAGAGKLSGFIEDELRHLGIKSASFSVDFQEKDLSPDGMDDVEFLFSANPDEAPKPLARVASGGELSRIMLVLKELMAQKCGGSVIIFDEADSGIGGAVAETVGRKIKNLASGNQVICITHLAQVAKFANSHLKVSKSVSGGKTNVYIQHLDINERVEELARMMGGISVTQKTREAAHEMLNQ